MNDESNPAQAPIDLLLQPTPANQDKLRERIRDKMAWAKSISDGIKYRRLAEKARISHDKLDHFMQSDSYLEPEPYLHLLRHMWDDSLWSDQWRLTAGSSAAPSMLFHALAGFLDVGEISRRGLIEEMPGVYRAWRPSMHVPGSYILGMLEVRYDEEAGTLAVIEKQKFKGSECESPQEEHYEGVMVKKSDSYVIIARQSARHKGPPRVTILSNCLHQEYSARAMQGLVIGCYGRAMFAAPAYFERVGDGDAASLEESLDIVQAIPPSVAGKLKFSVVEDVIRF
jgi:hypothetical protein